MATPDLQRSFIRAGERPSAPCVEAQGADSHHLLIKLQNSFDLSGDHLQGRLRDLVQRRYRLCIGLVGLLRRDHLGKLCRDIHV